MMKALLLFLLATSVAFADDTTERADALFKKGKDLMAAQQFAQACAAFDRSHQIEPAVTTLLNRADCREKAGQLATAWKLFVEAEQQTRAATDDAGKAMNATATTRAAKLEPRVSKVTIKTPPEPIFELALDDQPVGPNKPLPLDGGTYKLTATAPGYQPWSTSVVVPPEGGNQTIEVPASTGTEPRRQGPDLVTPTRRASRVPAIAIGATGVGLAIVGVLVMRSGDGIYDEAKLEPDDERQESLWKSANKRRYIGQALVVGGIASAGVAVALLVLRRDEKPDKLSVTPAVTAGSVGLVVGRAW